MNSRAAIPPARRSIFRLESLLASIYIVLRASFGFVEVGSRRALLGYCIFSGSGLPEPTVADRRPMAGPGLPVRFVTGSTFFGLETEEGIYL